MTPQDLADRLEKAVEALIAASMQILHHDGRDGDEVDVYERAQLRKAFTPILVSLRNSDSKTVPVHSGRHTAAEGGRSDDLMTKVGLAPTIFSASLRRSAPASGETRTAVEPEALIAKTYAQVISEGMAIYRNEGNDISDRRAIRAFIDRFELRARTPRGETRGESTP